MSTQSAPDLEHLLALLADRALEGLTPGRAAELAGLVGSLPDLDDEALDRAAAEIDLALSPPPDRPLSAALRRAVVADLEMRAAAEAAPKSAARPAPRRAAATARAAAPAADLPAPEPAAAGPETGPFFAPAADATRAHPAPAADATRTHPGLAAVRRLRVAGVDGPMALAGWILAGILVLLWIAARLSGVGAPAADVLRAPDAITLSVAAGPGRDADALQGTLTWSPSRNAGVLQVEGLAANDPSARRYQAWVIDAGGEERFVPAAVFDAYGEAGPLEVLLRPALPVGEAARFAITLEAPRGAATPTPGLEKPVAVAAPQ